MRKRLRCLLAVCMTGICLSGCGHKVDTPAAAEPEETTEITRKTKIDAENNDKKTDAENYTLQCIDAVYGTALPDAEVRILDEEGKEAAKGKTNAEGLADMELAEGFYQMEVKKDGYYTEQKNLEVRTTGQQDRIRLVSTFDEDKYLVMLEWEGNADLDLMMYQAFLDGKESATPCEGYETDIMYNIELSVGEKYSIYDIADKFEEMNTDSNSESEREYTFLDMENDTIPELLVRFKCQDIPGLSWQAYFIVKYQNNALNILYCRTVLYGDDSLDFNYYGFEETSGGGAGYWQDMVRMPDAAGRFTELYKVESMGPTAFVCRNYVINGKKFVTYTIYDEASSDDRELCMETVANFQAEGSELITEEEIDAAIEREVEPEIMELWKAEDTKLEWNKLTFP